MTAPVISLVDAVIAAINGAASKSIVRRYAPFDESASLPGGKWEAFASTEDVTKKRRVDVVRSTVGLVYRRTMPAANSGAPNPLENNTFLDGCMNEVESVKALFREDGALADTAIADKWVFESMRNNPVYNPEVLKNNQLFVSIVFLEFLTLQG